LRGVDSSEDKTRPYSSAHGSGSTTNSALEKASVYGVCAEDEADVDKSEAFEDSWFTVAEEVSDSEMPPEFLKPTPQVAWASSSRSERPAPV
jgi:hypothetical protein